MPIKIKLGIYIVLFLLSHRSIFGSSCEPKDYFQDFSGLEINLKSIIDYPTDGFKTQEQIKDECKNAHLRRNIYDPKSKYFSEMVQDCLNSYLEEIEWLKSHGTTCENRKVYFDELKKNSISKITYFKKIKKIAPELVLIGENHNFFKGEKAISIYQELKDTIPSFNCLLLEMDHGAQKYLDMCLNSDCPKEGVTISGDENTTTLTGVQYDLDLKLEVEFAKKNNIKLIAIDNRKFGYASEAREHSMWERTLKLKEMGCKMSVFSVGKNHIMDRYYGKKQLMGEEFQKASKEDQNESLDAYKKSSYFISGLKNSKINYLSLNIENTNPQREFDALYSSGYDWKNWSICKENFTLIPPSSGSVFQHKRLKGSPVMERTVQGGYRHYEYFDATLFLAP